MKRFNDKVAIVTGGATGIGFAIAQRLLAEGAAVAIAGNRADDGERALAALASGMAEFVLVDVTQQAEVQAMIGDVAARHGRLDVLVNNAGGGCLTPFGSLQMADWRRVIDINLSAIVYSAQAALERLPGLPVGGQVRLADPGRATGGGRATRDWLVGAVEQDRELLLAAAGR